MNLNEFQKSGVGTINVTDSLKAPLLGLKIELNENSSIPQTNDLIISVSKGEDTKEIKHPLTSPLYRINSVSDVFLIEPSFEGNKVSMKAKVSRKIGIQHVESEIHVGGVLSGKTIRTIEGLSAIKSLVNESLITTNNYEIKVQARDIYDNGVLKATRYELIETQNNAILYWEEDSDTTGITTSGFSSYILPADFGVVTAIHSSANTCLVFYNTNTNILDEETIEELDYQPIILFEGENSISCNYENASIELVYPKNNDLTKYFLANTYTYSLNNEDKFLTLDDLYFKNCFTEIEENIINAIFNKLTIKCLDSTTGNFSLDCDGNLVVNSITTKVQDEASSDIDFDQIYPIGSIYMSVNNVNPSTLFGGTWQAFASGRTIVGVDASQTEFNTVQKAGGSKMQTLTEAQLPLVGGQIAIHGGESGSNLWQPTGVFSSSAVNAGKYKTMNQASGASSIGVLDFRFGSGEAHNNLPPYITVYMWKRAA